MKNLWLLLLGVIFFSGCATNIHPTAEVNPPPVEAFKNFTHFDLRKVELATGYQEHKVNQRAAVKVDQNMRLRVRDQITQWNKDGQYQRPERRLVIKPVIEKIKFIYGASRYWAGPFAGSSAIRVKVSFIDEESGSVIAEPEFYQRSNAFAEAFSFSVADSLMLTRTGDMIATYIKSNYQKPIGSSVTEVQTADGK